MLAFFEGPASYAQARIWLDERVRFDPEKPQVAIYNMPFLYRLSTSGTLSITRLRRALSIVVMKHESLRTSIFFDTDRNMLMQQIIVPTDDDCQRLFSFMESTIATEEELSSIMHDERGNPTHFDLARGLVFRCHIIHHTLASSDDFLCGGAALVFNFHHALFDFPSMPIFLRDLRQAYSGDRLEEVDDKMHLRYLDCKFASFLALKMKLCVFVCHLW